MKRYVSLSLLLLALAGAGTTAAAQPATPAPEPPPAGIERSGFLIGFGIGGGGIVPDCSDCESLDGPGLELHIGGMLNDRVGLMYDISSVVASFDDGSRLSHSIHALAVQYWTTSRFWLKGGLGLGQLRADDGSGTTLGSDEKLALLGALGYEVYQSRSFALDLGLRLGTVKYAATVTNATFMVGFNWY